MILFIWPMFGQKSKHASEKNPSFTKKGPGRVHQQGKKVKPQ